MFKKNIIKKTKKAFTLVEVLLVVGLAVVLSAGTYMLYTQAKTDVFTKQESSFIRSLKNIINEINAAVDHFDQVTAANLIAGGAISTGNISGTNVVNTRGATVTITPVQLVINRVPLPATGTANVYIISIPGYSSRECIAIVNDNHLDFDAILVINPTHAGGTWVKQKPTTDYSLSNATGACLSTSSTETTNTVNFYTYKTVTNY